MANPNVGSKFVSVNLNKSYGQRSNNYSGGGASRVRSTAGGVVAGGGGTSGGGMVVLSRSRSTIVGVQKGGPKLSVPPPLNLPSLRKEHEKFDSTSSGGGAAGGSSSGPGARPSSSGIGWTKPAAVVVQEKDTGGDDRSLFERSGVGSPRINASGSSDQMNRGNNSVYMPPSARSGPLITPTHEFPSVQRAVLLRGEDFPSLQASLPVLSGASQKQKDGLNQKQNQKVSSDTDEQLGSSHLRPPSVMPTQPNQSSRLNDKASDDKEGGMNYRNGGLRNNEPVRKQDDIFPSPLPLVRLHHTSDWADDERDTGHGIPDRERDQGYSKSEFLWDRDFDFPRASVPPRTSVQNRESRGLHHEETGRPPSGGYLRGNAYSRDTGNPSREGRERSSWRSSLVKDGLNADRNGIGARALGGNRENGKEMKYGQPQYWDGARDGFSNGFSGSQDLRYGRRDTGYGQGTRQSANHFVESYSGRGVEQTKMDSYGGDFSNRYGDDSFQNGSLMKTSDKGYFANDAVVGVNREKHSTNSKQYMEEPFMKDFGGNTDFDGRDPLTGNLVGVLKRKKDVVKQTEFHDPVRESFEAELERVQKLQEQERQRVIEEQARVLELVRREEEERERVAREEEERRRRHEEEVREAAWKAEQERLEAVRKAEELRVAREEEKRRMLLEEERRKEAARKKLLELEARIAKRQAEITKENEYSSGVRDEKNAGVFHEKDTMRIADVVDWEDGERMVERITSSASSDSSLNRSFDTTSRPHYPRDGDTFQDRGKLSNSWRRDVFDNGSSSAFIWQDQETGYRSPKRDSYAAGRQFARKEFNGGPGTVPAKTSFRGFPENAMVDHYPPARGNRWNLSGEDDPYNRNSEYDPEFHDNFADRFSDMGWGLGHSRPNHHGPYPDRPYQNSDADGFSPFGGKSRHIMRQPRVLPPPSVASVSRSTFRSEIESPSSSAFRDRELSYHHSPGKSEPVLQKRYDIDFQEEPDQPRNVDSLEENARCHGLDAKNDTPRCDSQSSLSVSSPPSSPTHLSHDDMEDSEEPPSQPIAVHGDEIQFSDNEEDVSVAEVSTASQLGTSNFISPLEDDEWDIDNHQDLPEQEEYDEEEDGYREDDEVHDMDEGDGGLPQEFADLQLEVDSPSKENRLVVSLAESLDVVVPTYENLEITSTNGEKTVGFQQVSSNVAEVRSRDKLERAQSGSDSPKGKEEMIPENDKACVDLDIQPVSAVQGSEASAGWHLDCAEDSDALTLPHPSLVSSGDTTLPPSTTEATMSRVAASPSQTDGPVKLQFGLFSGPSLIPSPVPAIQIGSIQMPLHLHPQGGHSLTQLHPTPPPYFQFGQLRYTSPGILPLGPQSMSFVQPSVPSQGSFNHNQNGPLNNQVGQDSSILNNCGRDKMVAVSVNYQHSVQTPLEQSQEDSSKDLTVLSLRQDVESEVTQPHSRGGSSILGDGSLRSQPISQENSRYQYFVGKRSYRPNVSTRASQSQLHAESSTSQVISKSLGSSFGSKGKKYVVKNSGPRQPIPVSEPVQEFRGFLPRARPKFSRTEFRVRDDRRQTDDLNLPSHLDPERSNFSGRLSGVVRRTSKQMPEAEGVSLESLSARDVGSESKKVTSIYRSHAREETSKRYGNFDEDIDAPLRSGVVRVFEQPGIEAPSDEDDFIEVRSKRQMLIDRREQREKEIKAKARIVKAPKKRRAAPQNNNASTFSAKKTSSSFGGPSNSTYSKSVISSDQSLERHTRYTKNIVSPPLAPIGTPVNSDTQADKRTYSTKSPHTGSISVISTNGTSLVSNQSFENESDLLDTIPTSLSPWGNARMNQQVMSLTQTQLDEAMKPARFESHVPSIGDRTSAVIEPSKLSSLAVTQEKSFASTASPLNSLLAGEKIQFGAVTSPTILPPSSHTASTVMGPPGSCMSDVPVEHNLSALENDCSLFFEKEKHLDLGDSEAEAEAAASAVAVAAISSDEAVGDGCSASASETKTSGGAENEGLSSEGGISNQQSGSQSRAEESLSVALPADLSVETPSLSLWPSLPSPHHSSGQVMSHFPGGPPSHFPCYEMNPMLGGPIFSFSPHDEAAANQMQSQKSSVSASGPMGGWQQCHSGVDSFYGPPAGYTGHYISPSGGMPGVQGPPHMVVYNHFTPVGQFGQVGLSFMGTHYIPSGKQPDWKHTPASSTMGMGEGDINNMSIPSVQHSAPNMPPPIQHLAPGSPLLPMGSPLAMFDMSPFQQADVPVQARWSHFSAPSLHSAPISMPLPHHTEGVLPQQHFSQGLSVDKSIGNRFHESSSAASDNGRNFSVDSVTTVTQFPDELGLMDTSSTTTSQVPASRPVSYSSTIMNGKAQSEPTQNLSGSTASNPGDSSSSSSNSNSNSNNQSMNAAAVKTSSAQQQAPSTQQYLHSTGYSDQRQKVSSGGEWSHRRTGYPGRTQSSGTDKKVIHSKVKQIYVAKPATNQASST